jgi:hypothetical protein
VALPVSRQRLQGERLRVLLTGNKAKPEGKPMNREQAIEIARECAKAKPQAYYAEPFQPHEWVIDAICEPL